MDGGALSSSRLVAESTSPPHSFSMDTTSFSLCPVIDTSCPTEASMSRFQDERGLHGVFLDGDEARSPAQTSAFPSTEQPWLACSVNSFTALRLPARALCTAAASEVTHQRSASISMLQPDLRSIQPPPIGSAQSVLSSRGMAPAVRAGGQGAQSTPPCRRTARASLWIERTRRTQIAEAGGARGPTPRRLRALWRRRVTSRGTRAGSWDSAAAAVTT